MAAFDYRCERCGVFESHFPVGTAPPSRACPRCAGEARRILSSPALLLMEPALARAMDADRRSAFEPAVVDAPPRRTKAARRTGNPLHAGLPQP